MTNKKIKYKPIDPEISQLAEDHHHDPQAILEVLSSLQERHGNLSPEVINDVGRALLTPPAQAYGVASFYSMLNLGKKSDKVIRVCDGPVCWLCGGDEARHAMDQAYIESEGRRVSRTSCLGLCDRAPAMLVNETQVGPYNPGSAGKLSSGEIGVLPNYSQARKGELRVMMANAGKIDPDSISSALEYGAYQGLKSALEQSPEAVISEVEASGLSGRGGAGFPVGRKWKFVAQAKRSLKYIVCNADESEPLIFKDRVLIDTNPHQILEGMAVAGYACGAEQAFIYIRGEYASQAERLLDARGGGVYLWRRDRIDRIIRGQAG
jgi:NADH-quinone oxidoreductase subunit F